MLYDREIMQLQRQVEQLEALRQELQKLIDRSSDPAIKAVYQEQLNGIIDDIDEVHRAIDILKHKQDGSKNGYDKHAEEVDWTDPANWPDIRKLFGFGEGEEPIN